MNKSNLILLICIFIHCSLFAQYPPQAGLQGSTAVYKDSNIIRAWGNDFSLNLGWINALDTNLGKVQFYNPLHAQGKADGFIISLGDGGEIVYSFANPIINGEGYDFAIFENGFANPAEANEAFLELAEVSVSENGIHYVKFPSNCLLDTTTQIPGFGVYSDCRKINNLAGKYLLNYGTPFDLEVFSMLSSINVMNIHYVKIKDVVGSVDETVCTRDADNRKINDPFPTPFISAGFDIDAIGIINPKYPTSIEIESLIDDEITLYPNPSQSIIYLTSSSMIQHVKVRDALGKIIFLSNHIPSSINIENWNSGIYFLELQKKNGNKSIQKIMKF